MAHSCRLQSVSAQRLELLGTVEPRQQPLGLRVQDAPGVPTDCWGRIWFEQPAVVGMRPIVPYLCLSS